MCRHRLREARHRRLRSALTIDPRIPSRRRTRAVRRMPRPRHRIGHVGPLGKTSVPGLRARRNTPAAPIAARPRVKRPSDSPAASNSVFQFVDRARAPAIEVSIGSGTAWNSISRPAWSSTASVMPLTLSGGFRPMMLFSRPIGIEQARARAIPEVHRHRAWRREQRPSAGLVVRGVDVARPVEVESHAARGRRRTGRRSRAGRRSPAARSCSAAGQLRQD